MGSTSADHPIKRHPRILVIEDDPDQRDLICEALRLHYQGAPDDTIVGVATVDETVKANPERFDVVLQDYNRPDVNGLELLTQIRKMADVPVIIVTSHNDLATATKALRQGAEDYVVKLGDYLFALPVVIEKAIRQHRVRRQNARLQQDLEAMLSELTTKNVQLRESLQQLETMATTDHLTGLANRRRFGEVLQRTYSQATRYGFDLTCCMCDLDHYKQINDTRGHIVGDQLLLLTAEVIRGTLRTSDVAARYGGDEFVLLLPHTDVDRALAVCERIRDELTDRAAQRGDLVQRLTLSVGIASLRANQPDNADALVAMADRALYVAKDKGKDRIVVHQGGRIGQNPRLSVAGGVLPRDAASRLCGKCQPEKGIV
ncbi:MAG: diguanylate cyclase [Phycisphaerae bacterium]|nr:diguanylate cyclase [Phycisphaerae bacterium]